MSGRRENYFPDLCVYNLSMHIKYLNIAASDPHLLVILLDILPLNYLIHRKTQAAEKNENISRSFTIDSLSEKCILYFFMKEHFQVSNKRKNK